MENDKCTWEWEEIGDYYQTKCDNAFSFNDGSPHDNKFLFCPYCGKIIWDITPAGELEEEGEENGE